jgi:hypothetical protein
MDNLFKTYVLTQAINMMQPAPTLILDTLFKRKKGQISDAFMWELKEGSETILDNIKVSAEAQVSQGTGRKVITVAAPRYAEKRFIAAAELNALRAYGSSYGAQLLAEKIGDEQRDMKGKIDRTREFMAAKLLSGQIVDKSGNVLVDFGFPASFKPTLTGTDLWTDSSSDPIKKIRAWKKKISQAIGGVDKFIAFVGSDVMDALLDNEKVLEKLKYTVGNQLAEEGRIINLAGVTMYEYYGSYLDDSGTRHDYIPADRFILVGYTGENFAEMYAPIIDLKAPTGVGKNKKAQIYFSKSWEVEDPSGRWIKSEARPLPVMTVSGSVVYAKVV